MGNCRRLLSGIDQFTELLGRAAAWLTLLMVLATCLVVGLRYGLDQGSIALQESITYMHAAVFLLAAGFTLKHGGHVRVDVFYRHFSARSKAWVDSLGVLLLLLPFCAFLLFISWDFVSRAWQIGEISSEPGGLPLVYLLKTLIPLMAITLALQGVAELLRNALTLMGEPADDSEHKENV